MKNCTFCNLTKNDEKYLLLETDYFKLYLADKQDYVGRCIVVSKRHCRSLSLLNEDEWIDLKTIVDLTEKMCRCVLGADLCNWSCLMNDFFKSDFPNPHLHIHIRPRHKKPVELGNTFFSDDEFGHHYKNHNHFLLSEDEMKLLFELFQKYIDKELK